MICIIVAFLYRSLFIACCLFACLLLGGGDSSCVRMCVCLFVFCPEGVVVGCGCVCWDSLARGGGVALALKGG